MGQAFRHRGVHHVSINVADAAVAERFYVDVLGFEKMQRPDFPMAGSWLRCGDQELHLIQVQDHVAPKGQHFALAVDDLEEARSALEARGVELSRTFEIPGIAWQCFFHDPAGNMIELNQQKR